LDFVEGDSVLKNNIQSSAEINFEMSSIEMTDVFIDTFKLKLLLYSPYYAEACNEFMVLISAL